MERRPQRSSAQLVAEPDRLQCAPAAAQPAVDPELTAARNPGRTSPWLLSQRSRADRRTRRADRPAAREPAHANEPRHAAVAGTAAADPRRAGTSAADPACAEAGHADHADAAGGAGHGDESVAGGASDCGADAARTAGDRETGHVDHAASRGEGRDQGRQPRGIGQPGQGRREDHPTRRQQDRSAGRDQPGPGRRGRVRPPVSGAADLHRPQRHRGWGAPTVGWIRHVDRWTGRRSG